MAKIPDKISMQPDLRDVRGASIRPSVKIPSKMDKYKDPRRQRREKIDYDESEDFDDVDTHRWELFDHLQDNLLHDKNIVATMCAEEFPPTLKVTDLNGNEFELPIDVVDETYSPLDQAPLRYSAMEDQACATILNSVKKCLNGYAYVTDIKSVDDSVSGPCLYVENDYGEKFLIGIVHMVGISEARIGKVTNFTKASELAYELEKMVDQYGDFRVVIDDSAFGYMDINKRKSLTIGNDPNCDESDTVYVINSI